MRLQQHASANKRFRRVQWLAMASALLASTASLAWGGEGFSSSGFGNATRLRSASPGQAGGLRPTRIGAVPTESGGNKSSRTTAPRQHQLAAPVRIDPQPKEAITSSRRTAQQSPSGLTLRPAEPVALDEPLQAPLSSRGSNKKKSSLLDSYRNAKDDVVADSNRLMIREATEPAISRPSSQSPNPTVVVPKPALAPVEGPEPVTAEYEEDTVDAPMQPEEEHLAPIISSAGLKRPAGLGVRREPDFVPPPSHTPPDVSLPPMQPKTSAIPSKRSTTQLNVQPDVQPTAYPSTEMPATPSLQARRKFRGGPQAASEHEDAPQKSSRREFASRDAYEEDEAAVASTSLARLEMPQVDDDSEQQPADEAKPQSSVSKPDITLRWASSEKAREGQPSATSKTKAASSTGRILFLPPEPTPPKPEQQPRLLEVPAAARALQATETENQEAATSASSKPSAKVGSASREKPAVLLRKPAFAVGSPSSGETR